MNPDENSDHKSNHNQRIEGHWIFGTVEWSKSLDLTYISGEVGLVHVERRGVETLMPLIRDNISEGSAILTDKWPLYQRIAAEANLIHESINQLNFISLDPRWATYGPLRVFEHIL
ncbi:hypothetical protein RF11_13347 [Thelohanellus kitauei]|uniref:ISXO2-like transposase domain-containing protein n=1 Tax=Thelohanellus kitauei TaxID=669202 RepID=A0A0C2N905_THEKT|nr:hypothetical protein RF11_13347 [Thelohanellus kitauei]